jgi:hypothetical protein
VPRKGTIYNIVPKLSLMGSVTDQKNLEKHVLTEEKLDDIKAQLEANPKKSLHLLSPQCGLAECKAQTDSKFLKLLPYKTTVIYKPFASRLRSENTILQVVSGIGIQRTF